MGAMIERAQAMNTVVFVGNLTRDPELVFSQSGLARAKVSIALDLPPAREGERERDPEYRNITVFGKQAENVAESLTKGTRVLVVGRSETYKIDAEIDGELRAITVTNYVAQHIGPELRWSTAQVTRNPREGHAQGNGRRPATEPEPDEDEAPRRGYQRREPAREERESRPTRQSRPSQRAPRRQEPDDSDDF